MTLAEKNDHCQQAKSGTVVQQHFTWRAPGLNYQGLISHLSRFPLRAWTPSRKNSALEWQELLLRWAWFPEAQVNRDKAQRINSLCRGPVQQEIDVRWKCGWSRVTVRLGLSAISELRVAISQIQQRANSGGKVNHRPQGKKQRF